MRKMTFIVYSQVQEQQLAGSLGMPEYSYYFVLKGFLPALKELGRVIVVNSPQKEVDGIYDDCLSRGEDCIFLSFSPPNKAITGLRCPTVCVLAWEYDRIPDEVWDENPNNDWRKVFADHGRAITLSQYSADAVKKAMGGDFPVRAIPSIVWDFFESFRKKNGHNTTFGQREILIDGNVIDSRKYRIEPDVFEPLKAFTNLQLKHWSGETVFMGFAKTDEYSAYLGGFYKPEAWGSWSRIRSPWVLIPYHISGMVNLRIFARGYGFNANKEIVVSLGDKSNKVFLREDFTEISISFYLDKPDNILRFKGLDLAPPIGAKDPRCMGIGLKHIELSGSPLKLQEWSGETIHLGFSKNDPCRTALAGFYQSEDWGAWSQTSEPWIFIPYTLTDTVNLTLFACGYGYNSNKEIRVKLGSETKKIRLKANFTEISISFNLKKPENVLRISELDLTPVPGAEDTRTMGIGLQYVRISGNPNVKALHTATEVKNPVQKVMLSGVVYTSVFSPHDGRKNWQDIVTAFCTAFQDVKDATLVLKMSHHSLSSFLGKLHFFLQQASPFKCRIIALHGFMAEDEYEKLISITHYYVNGSRCEGLCLPLMEFMACRKPCIAPNHTAMTDYVDDSSGFIIDSSIEPCMWPHDARDLFRALRYRIDWESLVNAYRQSYLLIKKKPRKYEILAENASERIFHFASQKVVKEKIADFLGNTDIQNKNPNASNPMVN